MAPRSRRKTSFLKDRLGAQLFAKNIRIIDDPFAPARATLAIVRRGRRQGQEACHHRRGAVLTSWLLDSATELREISELTTTGHAHRGVSSSPSPGPYNLHLEAGEATPTELMSDIKQGFYVTDLIGSGVNGRHRRL